MANERVNMNDVTDEFDEDVNLNSSWFWLEYKVQGALYFKAELYFMYINLETISWKEIPSSKLDPGIWEVPELFCKMLV